MSETLQPSVIEEVRLTAFKSFTGAVLPLTDLTLVVGRNGSGKSNALDGLWALSRLASGEDIRDALDGGRNGATVRGGAAGCAPFGSSASLRAGTPSDPAAGRASHSGRDGSLATQVLSRIPATAAGRDLHLAAAQVLSALRAVFVLDPVPHLMRGYVNSRDSLLRRDADNLSAAVASLLEDPSNAELIRAAMSRLNEQDVVDVRTTRSALDDVMLTLIERSHAGEHPVATRLMSDGLAPLPGHPRGAAAGADGRHLPGAAGV